MSQLQKFKTIKISDYFILLLFVILFICLSVLFSFLVIKDFSNPLDGVEDLGIWEYMGFYFSHNLKIFPFPIV